MRIVCVIPARYESSRMPGKPLADIWGKPMIWWVYHRVKDMDVFTDVICAIDDVRIRDKCEDLGVRYIMTKSDHPNHISRIHEVSEFIEADYYMCINGDEPMVTPECIIPVVPRDVVNFPYFGGAMRVLSNPATVIDSANIKLAVTDTGRCIYMSRSPIPFPKGTLAIEYKKYVGVECVNKSALDFFVNTPMGMMERVEDIDHLRFLENGVELHFDLVNSESISVDTYKDLEYVREKIGEEINFQKSKG